MSEKYIRLEMLLGEAAMQKLAASTVAVFGVGGVGSYVVESLARSGVGHLVLIDNDEVVLSNFNRQIMANEDTLGSSKVKAMAERIHRIDPKIRVDVYEMFYLPDRTEEIPFETFDYIVDAIDTVTAKIDLVLQAQKHAVPIISAMGCGNRLDPSKLVCTDLSKTYNDPLAKIMRKELKERGIHHLKVVYSPEKPLKPLKEIEEEDSRRRSTPGSSIFVPASAGLLIGSTVAQDLLK
ncbi:MAG: tRNA threonylcarbamoyladenosine dehydratase [Erysipelotrichaceae bacterium]|nr:tRNA threonylcarbamoyladenosine dehydratase [Erysipelotrichaceae bacterium]